MAILIIPEINELSYRRKLLKNRKTMDFYRETISFEKEEWEAFWKNHVNVDHTHSFYGYIFCDGCMDFTGSAAYCRNEETGRHECFVLIEEFRRNDGYGREGVRLLKETAKNYGIDELYATVDKDSSVIGFLKKVGFEEFEHNGDQVVYRTMTS